MPKPRVHQERNLLKDERNPGTIRVYICADPLPRMGIMQILDGMRFQVLNAPLRAVSRPSDQDVQAPDLFIVDGNDRPDSVSALVAELKAGTPSARVIVLADQFEPRAVQAGREAGVDGFCLTTSSREVLMHSVELAMLGELVIPSAMVLAFIKDGETAAEAGFGPEDALHRSAAPRRPFSNRELEVLGWLKEGAPNKIIARELNVTEATVKVHVKAILRKIGAGNRSQAAIWAAFHLPTEAATH